MNQPKFNDEKDQAENESEVEGGRKRRYLCKDLFHNYLLHGHDGAGDEPERPEADEGLESDLHRLPGLRSVPGSGELEPDDTGLEVRIFHGTLLYLIL